MCVYVCVDARAPFSDFSKEPRGNNAQVLWPELDNILCNCRTRGAPVVLRIPRAPRQLARMFYVRRARSVASGELLLRFFFFFAVSESVGDVNNPLRPGVTSA